MSELYFFDETELPKPFVLDDDISEVPQHSEPKKLGRKKIQYGTILRKMLGKADILPVFASIVVILRLEAEFQI